MTAYFLKQVEHQDRGAEGLCDGLPYHVDGVEILFWIGDRNPTELVTQALLSDALNAAKAYRDIVRVVYCQGEPSGFWANHNIPRLGYRL